VRAAIEQIDANPLLQRTDVAAERGLRDGARLCRTREIAGLGQGQEIFQPFQVERSVASK